MTDRDRMLSALDFQEADRVAIQDGPWPTTIRRWHEEGLPENIEPAEYFGFAMVGVSADLTMRLPTEVIEETDEYIITRSADGTIDKNWKHATSTPGRVDFLIKSRADWEEHKHRLEWNSNR